MAAIISADEAVPQVLTEIQAGGGLSLSAAGRQFPGHRGEWHCRPIYCVPLGDQGDAGRRWRGREVGSNSRRRAMAHISWCRRPVRRSPYPGCHPKLHIWPAPSPDSGRREPGQ